MRHVFRLAALSILSILGLAQMSLTTSGFCTRRLKPGRIPLLVLLLAVASVACASNTATGDTGIESSSEDDIVLHGLTLAGLRTAVDEVNACAASKDSGASLLLTQDDDGEYRLTLHAISLNELVHGPPIINSCQRTHLAGAPAFPDLTEAVRDPSPEAEAEFERMQSSCLEEAGYDIDLSSRSTARESLGQAFVTDPAAFQRCTAAALVAVR